MKKTEPYTAHAKFDEAREDGRFEEALASARSALDDASTLVERAEWKQRIGSLLFDIGRIAEGVAIAREALGDLTTTGDDPRKQIVHLNLLEHLALYTDGSGAKQLASRGLSIANDLLCRDECSEPKYHLWVAIANLTYRLERFQESRTAYLRAVELAPDDAKRLLAWLGVARVTDGFTEAYDILGENVLPRLPEHPELETVVFGQVGDLFLDNEEWRSARMAYDLALLGLRHDRLRSADAPWVADLHFRLSFALCELGEIDSAAENARSALKAANSDTPSFVTSGAQLVLGHVEASREQPRRALAHYQAALAAPDCPDACREQALESIQTLDV